MTLKEIRTKSNKLTEYIINKDILVAVVVAIGLIIAGLSLGWYNNRVIPANPATFAHYTAEPNNTLKFISNWDGPDYIRLSKTGYTDTNDANFFPLYPLLIHLVNKVVSSSLYSALLISWVSLVGAIYYYLKIVKKFFKIKRNKEALKAVLLFVLFPTSIFLVATYTESLFSFLALASIYYALEKKYLYTIMFAILAGLTHITALFLLVLLALILIDQKVKIKKVLIFGVLSSLGIITYMSLLFSKFNNPLAFITAQRSHGWLHLHTNYLTNIANNFNLINLIFIILLVLSVIYWWRKKWIFSVYSGLFLLIPLAGEFGGFDRYTLVAFPVQFMIYDKLKDKSLAYTLVIAFFSIIWAYTVMQYSGGYTGS